MVHLKQPTGITFFWSVYTLMLEAYHFYLIFPPDISLYYHVLKPDLLGNISSRSDGELAAGSLLEL